MKIFIKLVFALFALGFFVSLGLFGVVVYISYDLPQINSLADYSPPIPSRVYSKDGQLLMELSHEKRELTTIAEIPDSVISAFVAAEDSNFYTHSGIDYVGIARAMVKNIKAGRIVQGASTITQQVAKSLLLTSERTFKRKIKDLILARKIEEKLTKREILFLYLNQVYLGGGYWGVKSAFRGYFDKELNEASVAEVALVAGLLVAPSKYSPYSNPKAAKVRQRYVLKRMYETKKIGKEEYERALVENIKIQIRKPVPLRAGYFTDWVRQRLEAHFGKDDFITNGYEVITTLDWDLQKKAEREVLEGVKKIDKRQGYKGALAKLSEEEREEFLLKQRENIYKEASNYLIFKTDGTTEREFKAEENEFNEIRYQEIELLTKIKFRNKEFAVPGNNLKDKIIKFVDFSKPIKAVVTMASNSQRMIYANYAGLKIMIPYDNFKWAHERRVEVDRYHWGYVTQPETIVKPGDVILVSTEGKLESPKKYFHSNFTNRYKKNKELMSFLNKQRFYIGELDQGADVQGALLSVSPQSGEILAMVGGSDFSKSQFNRAVQSNRQPGSAFKPLIFAVGLENNYTPSSLLLDSPQALGGVDSSLSWKPRNYDGKFKGSMTYRRALETSRNIPTIKLTQDIGVKKITSFINRLNMNVDLPQDLSLSLGSFGVNLLNLVKMYSIFPNGGKALKLNSIISIKDRYGRVYHIDKEKQDPGLKEELSSDHMDQYSENNGLIEESDLKSDEKTEEENPFLVNLSDEQVYDPRLAYLMSNLLKGVIQRGTGRNTKDISSYIGGKTGTTNNYVDAWFLGFSPKVVTGVWTGFDNNQTLGFGETGAKAALPIWKEVMKVALRKFGDIDFIVPSGIVNVAIDVEKGKLYQDGPGRFMEAFVDGTEPGLKPISNGRESDDSGSILESDDYYSAQ